MTKDQIVQAPAARGEHCGFSRRGISVFGDFNSPAGFLQSYISPCEYFRKFPFPENTRTIFCGHSPDPSQLPVSNSVTGKMWGEDKSGGVLQVSAVGCLSHSLRPGGEGTTIRTAKPDPTISKTVRKRFQFYVECWQSRGSLRSIRTVFKRV